MSIIGIDVGNESSRIGIAGQGAVDVVLNEESKRETPSMVSFGDKQRFLGSAAAASAMLNMKNTVWQIKRLIGKKFRDPEVQSDLSMLPFTVTEGTDGWPMINVSYLSERRCFKPAEILGMILANLKRVAARATGLAPGDCVIGIPAFLTDTQRRSYLDAALVAGLEPRRLMHETTAAALYYGIYKTDLAADRDIYVSFVDVGHAHTQVAVASFRKGRLKILAYAFDRCLGGRDFDEVLFTHFAARFSSQYNIDVRSNAKSSQRLRAACEKLKKVLSANMEGVISIECLMDEKDVKGHITREEFERLSAHLLQRIRHPCEKAVADCRVHVDDIYAVEVIGSGSRVPAIGKMVASVFRKQPSRTLNASECVARGCAVQSAMLSPTVRVRKFEVQDQMVLPISLSWTGPAAAERDNEESLVTSGSVIFPTGVVFPAFKALRFGIEGQMFLLSASYADSPELPSTPFITFTVGPFISHNSEATRLDVGINVNLHGVIGASSAMLVVDDELAETSGDAHVQERSSSPKASKRRYSKTSVPYAEMPMKELSESQLQNAIEKVFDMEHQDRAVEEIQDAKNALEAFVYGMRDEFFGKLQDYASETEKNELLNKLQGTEAWLYEEGVDESKEVYASKLADLKKHVDLFEERRREEQERASVISDYLKTVNALRNEASHIADHVKVEQVVVKCREAEEWLAQVIQHQAQAPKYAKPPVSGQEIRNKANELERFCKYILSSDHTEAN